MSYIRNLERTIPKFPRIPKEISAICCQYFASIYKFLIWNYKKCYFATLDLKKKEKFGKMKDVKCEETDGLNEAKTGFGYFG